MSYLTEFPDFDAATMPAIPDGWTDRSWHNDGCPFFVHEASGVGLWIERADAAERENGGARFTAIQMTANTEHGWQHGDDVVLFETDDWAVVLRSLPAFTASATTLLPANLRAPIRDLDDAKRWIRDLCAAGLDFHFDDSPETIVSGRTNEPIFDEGGAEIVRARLLELYDFDWGPVHECPIGFMLEVINARDHVAMAEQRIRDDA